MEKTSEVEKENDILNEQQNEPIEETVDGEGETKKKKKKKRKKNKGRMLRNWFSLLHTISDSFFRIFIIFTVKC